MGTTKSVRLVVAASFAVLVAASLGIGSRADAAVISVNFAGATQTLAATDVAGIEQAGNWNNATGNVGTSVPLVDSEGNTTAALITYVATDYRDGSTFGNNPGVAGFSPLVVPNTPDPDTNNIYRGSLVGWNDDGPHEVTIALANIPYAKYDLYVYVGTSSQYSGSMSITDGTSTYSYQAPGDLVPPTALTKLNPAAYAYGTYAVFANKTSSAVTLTTSAGYAYSPSEVFGLQIVPVPEPASLGLLAVAGVGLIRRRGR